MLSFVNDVLEERGEKRASSEALGAVDWLAQKQHFFSFIAHPRRSPTHF